MSPEDQGSGLNRRRLLGLTGKTGAGAAALLAAGYVGYRLPDDDVAQGDGAGQRDGAGQGDGGGQGDGDGSTPATEVQVHETATFRTRPDLITPRVDITRHAPDDGREPNERFIFLEPYKFRNQNPPAIGRGPMIIDRDGNLVWFKPSGAKDFRVQAYQGEPVLTWWEGGSGGGYGLGKGVIFDSGYRQIATVEAVGKELQADLHEFQLTDRDTAYITVYRESEEDLRDIGGHRNGKLLSGLVQEIDVATGELLFEWDSLDHVSPSLSYRSASKKRDNVFDYFHINSIFEVDDDTILVSARNTWAIYLISKRTGKLIWTLGGRNSDFEQGTKETFFWQHDATMIAPNRILLFDNAAAPQRGPQSRGMIIELDHDAGASTLIQEYTHPTPLLAGFLGSAQQLSNGDVFIGWGTEPFFSQFSPSGRLKLDGQLPENVQNYRVTAHDWEGHPSDDPAIAVGTSKASGVMVYASWNGATNVTQWRVYAGEKKSKLTLQTTIDREGFETAIPVISRGPFFQVAALDEDGKELRRSTVAKIPS